MTPSSLGIYVDLDDVLCQTIEQLVEILASDFERRVEVEAVRHFDLGRSFGLDPAQLETFMERVHHPERLASLRPRPGATSALEGWQARGYRISVVTGRPPATAAASRDWLRRHGIPHDQLACVDKYGRAGAADGPALEFDELAGFGFRLAVEDSLETAVRLVERCGIPVALLDRPWNRDLSRLGRAARRGIVRCRDWSEVARRFPAP